MKRDVILNKPITSSFLSCENDTELILKKLFVESRPYSDILKRLLVVQNRDALDANYDMSEYSLKRLLDQEYIILGPKLDMQNNEQVKACLGIHFDNFTPTNNTEFRDCMIYICVMCHIDHWDLGNYRQRPFKIMGYIDGILNDTKLSGIGRLQFLGCVQKNLFDNWTLHALTYRAVHGSDDQMSNDEE